VVHNFQGLKVSSVMVAKFDEFPAFLSEGGLASNGSILTYETVDATSGMPYDDLRSIAWRLLEDIGVGIAAFNTPKSRNCLALQQQMEIFMILEHARRDDRVKALIWTGTGTKAFNAGADLRGNKTCTVPSHLVKAYAARCMAPQQDNMVMDHMTKAFWDFPKPVIIAVNGVAVGGGANIALANYGDVVICSRNARFMWPFAKLGLTPELASSMVIPWLVGMSKAKELMMTGDWFSAEEALRLNLVSVVCEPEALLPRAVDLAARIVAGSPHIAGLKLMKQVMNAPLREQLDAVLLREQDIIMQSVEATGGFMNAKL